MKTNFNFLNKHLYILATLLVSSLCFTGCWRDIDGGDLVGDNGTLIYVESILKSDESPSVVVKSAESAYSGRTPSILTDDEVEVSIGTSDWSRVLDFDKASQDFSLEGFKTFEGVDYRLNIIHKENEAIKSAFSKVVVPLKEKFSDLNFIEDYNAQSTIGYYNYSYDVAVSFKEESNGDFYLVLPVSRKVAKEGTIIQYDDEYNPYIINELYDAPRGARITNDSHGLLVSLQDTDERTIAFNVSLDGNLYGFNDNRLQKHVYFYLWNITEDYYKYIKSGGESTLTSNTLIGNPIIYLYFLKLIFIIR